MTSTTEETLEFLDGLLDNGFRFGNFLESQRDLLGLSQEELSEKTGISKQIICSLESKTEIPTIEQAAKLAEALKRPPGLFIEIAIQDQLKQAGSNLKVTISPKS